MASPFVWYDLMTTDLTAAIAFYEGVVGWKTTDSGMPNTYMLFNVGDRPVCGGMALTPQMLESGGRAAWVGHIGVADAGAAAQKAASLGGAILNPGQDIPGIGRFSVISDPQGAVVCLFAPADPNMAPPAPLPLNTPGDIGWRELLAADWEKAWDFYSANFGWTKGQTMQMGQMGAYQLFKTGGADDAGGMFNKPPQIPAVFWLYYFNVAGTATEAAERVKAGGGQVMNGPMEVPGPMFIVQCMDPQGAMFALVASSR
jgi:predicted enzyme related to lactoylglutathione lyase